MQTVSLWVELRDAWRCQSRVLGRRDAQHVTRMTLLFEVGLGEGVAGQDHSKQMCLVEFGWGHT